MPEGRVSVESIGTVAEANRYDLPQLTLRLDQAWRILNLNQELIRSADQKSYLLIVMSTLLVTYISTNLYKLMGMGMPVKFSLVLFIFAATMFYYFALSTLLARNRGKVGLSGQIPNLIFFGDIAQRAQPADYAACFHRADLHEVLDDVCHQIHQVAHIATRKYRAYRRAWIALLAELSMFVMLQFWIIL